MSLRRWKARHQIRNFFIACISRMFLIDEQDILFTFFFLQSPEIGYKPNFLDNIWRWHLANNVAFCPHTWWISNSGFVSSNPVANKEKPVFNFLEEYIILQNIYSTIKTGGNRIKLKNMVMLGSWVRTPSLIILVN